MKRFFVFLVLLFIYRSSTAQDTLKNGLYKYYSVNQLTSDFVFFRAVLEKAHPSLYRYQSKDSIDHYFEQAFTKLDHPLNDVEYWRILQGIVAKMGSGHTGVSLSKATTDLFNASPHQLLPFSIYTESNRLYLYKSHPSDTSYLKSGSEILVINNELGSSVLKQMQELMAGDGYSTAFKDYKIERDFLYLYNLLHGDQSQFLITYRYKGVIKTKLFKAITLTYHTAGTTNSLPQVSYPADMPATAILRVPNFTYTKQYYLLHEKLFSDIAAHNIKNLVIDVRGNTGGQLNVVSDLMKYFMKRDFRLNVSTEVVVSPGGFKKLAKKTEKGEVTLKDIQKFGHTLDRRFTSDNVQWLRVGGFSGNVFVLTNNGTFSAAAIFASAVKNQSDFKVIGEETGGGTAGCDGGLFADITLPETKMRIHLPLMWIHSFATGDPGHGLVPDIEISTAEKEKYFTEGLNPTIEVLKQTIFALDKKAQ